MHSEKFEIVKEYFDDTRWSAERVKNAIGKWITKAEFDEIVNKK